ncbi:MAG: HAD family hydrolase, partial [Proteobacteria bacterium]|nr:HAD family hydrolase [Pseudomonadota bacterium]
IFRAACTGLNLPADAVLHVGDDAQLDVAGANAAGLKSAWLNRHDAPWIGAAPPHIHVKSLHELADRLLQADVAPVVSRALA